MDPKEYEARLHLAKRKRASRYVEHLELNGVPVTVEVDPRLPQGAVAFRENKTGRVLCVYKAPGPKGRTH